MYPRGQQRRILIVAVDTQLMKERMTSIFFPLSRYDDDDGLVWAIYDVYDWGFRQWGC